MHSLLIRCRHKIIQIDGVLVVSSDLLLFNIRTSVSQSVVDRILHAGRVILASLDFFLYNSSLLEIKKNAHKSTFSVQPKWERAEKTGLAAAARIKYETNKQNKKNSSISNKLRKTNSSDHYQITNDIINIYIFSEPLLIFVAF